MRLTPIAIFYTVITIAAASSACAQEQPEIALLEAQDVQSGYLWTSSFQRADGSTCAWIRIEDGTMVSVLYDAAGGLCRNGPSDSADVFEFTGMQGEMAQFGGPDFTIVNNTGSMMSGDWNHTSRDARFDLENVVFRFLPDPD
jgi:hypothetical protein